MVKALFDARVEDLTRHHRVLMKCACGHEGVLSREELERHGVPTHERILGLGYKTRCLKCQRRGDIIDVSVITLNAVPAVLPKA